MPQPGPSLVLVKEASGVHPPASLEADALEVAPEQAAEPGDTGGPGAGMRGRVGGHGRAASHPKAQCRRYLTRSQSPLLDIPQKGDKQGIGKSRTLPVDHLTELLDKSR